MNDLLKRDAPGYRANVFVHADAPQYEAMLAWSKTADYRDWRLDERGRKGIWVSLHWYHHVCSAGWHPPSYGDLVKQYSDVGSK